MKIKDMTNAELNKAVAIEVMGFDKDETWRGSLNNEEWKPATYIDDAFRIISEKTDGNITLRRLWKDLEAKFPFETVWDCDFRIGDWFAYSINCATMQRAICEAALMAVRALK